MGRCRAAEERDPPARDSFTLAPPDKAREGTSPGDGCATIDGMDQQEQGADAVAAPDEACAFDDCACTGRNIGKFTSPAALLAIAETGLRSGYDIAERLRTMPLGGETGPDTGGLYRTLRRMERMNLVTSEWDTEGGGPARRMYRLTNLGDRCLRQWAGTLREHSRAIERFLDDYARFRDLEQPEAGGGEGGDPSPPAPTDRA